MPSSQLSSSQLRASQLSSSQLRAMLVGAIATLLFTFVGASSAFSTSAQAAPQKKSDTAKPRVAVLYFDHIGNDSELRFLRKGLTQMLITDLSDGDDLVIVERTDLEMVIQELNLGKTKFISRRTANKIGRMLGAQYLITGSYNNFRGTLHITAKLIDVELTSVEGISRHGKVEAFLGLEQQLATELRTVLSTAAATKKSTRKMSKQARRTAQKRAQKRMLARKAAKDKRTAKAGQAGKSLSARTVSQYGRALDSIDKGNKTLAMKQLGELTKSNPDFALAADELKVLLR
ncbi:MAG: hypothetical protein JKY56_09250 [Kofleriaceae bacterium]|nr:hypothetical protein [Kofleriaceae bacterium]